METVADFVAAVDAFIAVPKILVGAHSPVTWQRGRDPDEMRLKFPLEIGGEQAGHSLVISAFPNHHSLRFTFLLLFFEYDVSRLDFDKSVSHANNFLPFASSLPRTLKGPHWHSWAINRDGVRSIKHPLKLPFAIPFDETQQFDAALRWFCAMHFIELGAHEIVYPLRTRLI